MKMHQQSGNGAAVVDLRRPKETKPEVNPGNHIQLSVIGGPLSVGTKVDGMSDYIPQGDFTDEVIILDIANVIELNLTGSGEWAVTDYGQGLMYD